MRKSMNREGVRKEKARDMLLNLRTFAEVEDHIFEMTAKGFSAIKSRDIAEMQTCKEKLEELKKSLDDRDKLEAKLEPVIKRVKEMHPMGKICENILWDYAYGEHPNVTAAKEGISLDDYYQIRVEAISLFTEFLDDGLYEGDDEDGSV